MKFMKWQRRAIGILVILAFGLSAFFAPDMPEQMASHWNAAGKVDGHMPKDAAVLLLPGMMTFITLLYAAIPYLDPLKKNIQSFITYYENFFVVLIAFLLVLHIQILLWNLGTQISPNMLMPLMIGSLFFYIGVVMENTKRNWFIGIRTPWTLSSDVVWERTHKLGGTLFKAVGIISAVGILFQAYVIWFILAPVLLAALVLVLYSYVEYRKIIEV